MALEIGRGYNLNVKQAMNSYDATQLQIDSQLRKDLDALDNVLSLDAKERQQEKGKVWEKYWDRKFEADKTTATQLSDLSKTMVTQTQEIAKQRRETFKEARDFTKSMRDEIRLNPILKDFKEVSVRADQMNNTWDLYRSGRVDAGAVDQALITIFNKMLDPASVVREGEYARTEDQQGFIRSMAAGVDRFFTGGARIDDKMRKSLVDLAGEYLKVYDEKAQQELEPLFLEIEDFNDNTELDEPIDISRVFNMENIHFDQQRLNTIERFVFLSENLDDTGTDLPVAEFANPRLSPGGIGWRTDRHNNPIAFAVSQGGRNQFTNALDAVGIKWDYGDPFRDNSRMVTVRINGDPIEASRVVLANTNAIQNWYLNHTGKHILPKYNVQSGSDFSKLSKQQQNEIIAGIYKAEVGDGSLLASQQTNAF